MVTTTGNGAGTGQAGVGKPGGEIAEVRSGQNLSLSIYERIADPLAAAKFLGEAIAHSGMFGLTNPKQGVIFAWECLVRRMPPLMLKETYHVIQGSLSMRAEKMLSNFNEGGGKHRVLSRTGELASVEMTLNGEKQVFSLSWEDAKQEPFVYSGKEKEVVPLLLAGKLDKLKIKDKYATPRARSQMMWARVVSDGVRAVMPSAICGCYTPEEISDFSDLGVAVPSNDPMPNRSESVADGQAGEVIDGDFTVVETGTPDVESTEADESHTLPAQSADVSTAATEAAPEATGMEAAAGSESAEVDNGEAAAYCSAAQSARLKELYASCGLTDVQIENALKKRGAHNNRSLTAEAADGLIAVLEGKLAQLTAANKEAAAEIAGESRQPDDQPTSSKPNDPASAEQVDEARKSLIEFAQVDQGQFNRYRAHMLAGGLKASDLTVSECQELINGIKSKTLAAFFDLSLVNWKGKKVPF